MTHELIHDLANDDVLDLIPYEPGQPIEEVARKQGIPPEKIIKLASNENPLGPSPRAIIAMKKALERAHFYPDGGGYYLRHALAKKLNLSEENVVLGNGSNELIEFLFHAFTRSKQHSIVTNEHAFAVYQLMAQLFGIERIVVPDRHFTADLPAMLQAIRPETRLVFLANPNNPTGTRVDNNELLAWVRAMPKHVIVVLDEAYYEFLEEPPATLSLIQENRHVILLRTFSKIQGLAGLRIGYGLAPSALAGILQRVRQPFNANLIAQAGALAALEDEGHQQQTKEVTLVEREKLRVALEKMGREVIPSHANFLLVHVGDGEAVFQALLKRGIIVRSMKSYRLPAYIRISVGIPEQMKHLLNQLPEVFHEIGLSSQPLQTAATS